MANGSEAALTVREYLLRLDAGQAALDAKVDTILASLYIKADISQLTILQERVNNLERDKASHAAITATYKWLIGTALAALGAFSGLLYLVLASRH